MLSELTQAEIINGAVLVVTLHGDLGRHRKIGPVRLLRPIVVAAGIVPLFIDPLVTHGAGLAVELAGTAAGMLGGLAALALTRVYRSPRTGKPVSRAGSARAGRRAARHHGSDPQAGPGAAARDAGPARRRRRRGLGRPQPHARPRRRGAGR